MILGVVCGERARAITVCVVACGPPPISDLLEVVNDSGQPVTDSLGNPAVRTLSEVNEVPGPARPALFIQLGTPSHDVETLFQEVALKEHNGGLGDFITVERTFSGETVDIALCEPSDSCVPRVFMPPPEIPETGEPQDVADFSAPDGTHVHVIVQSVVPEPSTAVLLVAGLGCLLVARRQRTA
jgi:hypothetical protein